MKLQHQSYNCVLFEILSKVSCYWKSMLCIRQTGDLRNFIKERLIWANKDFEVDNILTKYIHLTYSFGHFRSIQPLDVGLHFKCHFIAVNPKIKRWVVNNVSSLFQYYYIMNPFLSVYWNSVVLSNIFYIHCNFKVHMWYMFLGGYLWPNHF